MNALQRLILLFRLAILARRAKMSPGSAGIVGLTGRSVTSIAPEGTVFVRGELWRARSMIDVSRGERVRVTGVEGVTLAVEAEQNGTVMR